MLVDSFSTDGTLDIARRYTDRIVQRPWRGSNDQKEHARGLARGDWVLSVDADEVVSPELDDVVQRLVPAGARA